MIIQTKFGLGEKVRRKGTNDVGYIHSIDLKVERDGSTTTQYEVRHFADENLHVNSDFGGGGYESEFESLENK